jgi:hypothetical protein
MSSPKKVKYTCPLCSVAYRVPAGRADAKCCGPCQRELDAEIAEQRERDRQAEQAAEADRQRRQEAQATIDQAQYDKRLALWAPDPVVKKPDVPDVNVPVPGYEMLSIASIGLLVIGVLGIVLGGGMLVVIITGEVEVPAGIALSTCFGGAVIGAFGESLRALRDIARNSFKNNR